jgi:hypothetical protein
MRVTTIPAKTIVEYELRVKAPSEDLRIAVIDHQLKEVEYGKGEIAKHFESGLYKVRVGIQSCLINLTKGDLTIIAESDGFRFYAEDGTEKEFRRFPEFSPITTQEEEVVESDGLYDSVWSGYVIQLILSDKSLSRKYATSSGVRGIAKERVEVKNKAIYSYMEDRYR